MPTYNTKCRKCNHYWKNYKYLCNYDCSRKGKEKIKPQNFTMMEIKKVLQNNLGIYISQENISNYSKEILKSINNKGIK